ncbi:hypothetical protein B0H11DRAFT_1912915 [Mycena galericulata]|nr:hypothetical protein B0H11DRAFT_1912915 [Mycena galericulata]
MSVADAGTVYEACDRKERGGDGGKGRKRFDDVVVPSKQTTFREHVHMPAAVYGGDAGDTRRLDLEDFAATFAQLSLVTSLRGRGLELDQAGQLKATLEHAALVDTL